MKEKIKNIVMGLRLTEELNEELKKEADKLGLTVTTYIRMILLQRNNN